MKSKMNSEDAMNKIHRIFEKRGARALDIARKEMLKEKIQSREARQALVYFMTEYWRDLARPSLVSMVCEAVGGDPELTIPAAVPMILISGAIDIHDDIIDLSIEKSGRPTVYGKFGKDIALLVGDALLFRGLILLGNLRKGSLPAKKADQVVEIAEKMFLELGDAEALELGLRGCFEVSPERYLRIVRRKAADVEAHTRIGAVLGNASVAEADTLGEYGRLLGMMIILRDDWLDVLELEELKSRIERESLPLPLLYCLHEPSTEAKLKSFLKKRTLTQRKLGEISETIQKAEALRKYVRLMRDLARQAVVKLETLKYGQDLKLLIDATVAL